MEDALARLHHHLEDQLFKCVLILVVMEDALAHKKKIGSKIQKP